MSTNFLNKKFENNRGKNRFVTVHTFTEEESQHILNGFEQKEKCKLYFNDIGNIVVKKEDTTIFDFTPKIITKTSDNRTSTAGLLNIVTRKKPSNPNKPPHQFVYSVENGLWIIYIGDKDTKQFELLYNPVPRKYANQLSKANRRDFLDRIAPYCQEVDILDPACFCINVENTDKNDPTENYQFCVNDLVGGNNARNFLLQKSGRNQYDILSQSCHCINVKCNVTHPLRRALIAATEACPTAFAFTNCAVNFDASDGSQINIRDSVNIAQECQTAMALSEDEKEAMKEEAPEVPTSPTPTSPTSPTTPAPTPEVPTTPTSPVPITPATYEREQIDERDRIDEREQIDVRDRIDERDDTPPPPSPTMEPESEQKKGLSAGAIASIVLGIITLIVFIIWFFVWLLS